MTIAVPIITGRKSGSSGSTPTEAKNDLLSTSYAKMLLALGEGEWEGTIDGTMIYLDGTPLIDSQGNENFPGTKWEFRPGSVQQSYIQGIPSVENETTVNTELNSDNDWIRSITNSMLSAVRLRLRWPTIQQQKDNGDIVGYTIAYAIDVATDGGSYQTVLSTSVSGKTNQQYERSHRVDLPAGNSWQVRVRRITPNQNKATVGDTMFISAITEIVDAKFTYPNTALLYVEFDASQFSNIPTVAVEKKLRLVRVPTNYDPEARTYSGTWDGSFKIAWTNNPAWVSYDIILEDRFSVGQRITADLVDKWGLYQIAQYCDELVPDGKGGMEPRFLCDVYIQQPKEAWQVLRDLAAIYRGMTYWANGQMVTIADLPRDMDFLYTNANVKGGQFNYSGTSVRSKFSRALVSWDNPDNEYNSDVTSVADAKLQRRYGDNPVELSAIGCTRESEAQRRGKWAIYTNNNDRTVSFSVGLDGQIPLPGYIIGVADSLIAGKRIGGRITAIDGLNITLDSDPEAAINDRLRINLPSGKAERRTIIGVNGRVITISTAFSETPEPQLQWALESDSLEPQLYRVTTVKKADSDDIEYQIAGIAYNPDKFTSIDNGSKLIDRPISILPSKVQQPPASVTISQRTYIEQTQSITVMLISWPAANGAISYDVEWRKDSGEWVTLPRTGSTSAEVRGVYTGDYLARVRAINSVDVASIYRESALTPVTGKTGTPPALASLTTSSIVFGIDLNWSFPAGAEDTLYTEIYYATSSTGANETLLGQYAYPLDNHTLNGLAAGVSFWFKARIVDRTGNIGPWTDYVQGSSSSDAGAILDYLTGKITESELAQDLLQPIQSIPTLTANIDSINQQLAEITGAGAWVNTTVYDSGDYVTYDDGTGISLYRAKQDAIPAGTLPTNTTYWEYVGDYASIGEAVAALTASVTDLENSIDVLDGQLVANVRRTDTMIAAYRDDDDGEGRLADVLAGWKSKAAIKLEQKTRASEIEAEAQQRLNLTAIVDNNYSDITQQLTVLSNDQQSTAQSLEQVVSTVGDNTAAVQQVSQAQADLEGNVSAMWKVSMNVTADGKYYAAGFGVGFENEDQGLQSAFYVLANKFAILNQVTGTSAVTLPFAVQNGQVLINNAVIGTLQNKTIIQRVGTSMQVFGIGFGSSGQFVEWFGPDVGDPSNCTEANATSYKKTNGDQFTGGSFRSGVLQNGYQNTGISAYAVGDYPVSFGPFGTNGRSKTVLLSISAAAPTVQFGTHLDGWSPGTLPKPVFGWAIERKIGSGSWTQIAAGTITGSTVVHQDEIPDTNQYNYYSTSSIDGSYTYTDNSVSMDNFNYRVRVTAWTSVYSGSNPTARQSIGLTSIES